MFKNLDFNTDIRANFEMELRDGTSRWNFEMELRDGTSRRKLQDPPSKIEGGAPSEFFWFAREKRESRG
jgi:hypothetical protein